MQRALRIGQAASRSARCWVTSSAAPPPLDLAKSFSSLTLPPYSEEGMRNVAERVLPSASLHPEFLPHSPMTVRGFLRGRTEINDSFVATRVRRVRNQRVPAA